METHFFLRVPNPHYYFPVNNGKKYFMYQYILQMQKFSINRYE